jgi:hypothetical protein
LSLGDLRGYRNHESDWYSGIDSSLTGTREVTIETATKHILLNGALIPPAMNIEEDVSTIERPMGPVIAEVQKPEHLSPVHAATIAHTRCHRSDHHRDVVFESAVCSLAESSSPCLYLLGCYL